MARTEWTPELVALLPSWRGDGEPVASAPLTTFPKMNVRGTSAAAQAVLKTGKIGAPAAEIEAGPFAFAAVEGPERAPLARALVDRWVAAFGTAGTIDLFSRMADGPARWAYPSFLEAAALRLRQHLAHADDYDAALAVAKKLVAKFEVGKDVRRSEPFGQRPLPEFLAFLFPDHRPFFAIAKEHNEITEWTHTFLIGAVSTPAELQEIWPKASGSDWFLSFVRRFGDPALPLLVKYPYPSIGLSRALSVFVEPSAAAALMRALSERECLPVVTSYFQDHPELAPAALKALPKSAKPAVRKAATRMLTLAPKKVAAEPKKPARTRSLVDPAGPTARAIGEQTVTRRRLRICDPATAPTWDCRADSMAARDLVHAMRRGAAIVEIGGVESVQIWSTADGLAVLEHHPRAGIDPRSPLVGRYVAQLAVPKDSKKIGTITTRGGLVFAVVHAALTAANVAKIPKRTGRAVRLSASGFQSACVVPLAAGRYDVFVERVGGAKALSTEIGKIDRRVRLVRVS